MSLSWLQVISKLAQSCPKVVSKLFQSCPKVIPMLLLSCSSQMMPRGPNLCDYVATSLLIECLHFAAVQCLDWNPVRLELFRKEDDILLIWRQHIFGIKSKKTVRKLPEKQNFNYIDKVIYINKDYGFANVIEIYINRYPSYKSSWLSSQPIPSCHGGSNQIHGTAR